METQIARLITLNIGLTLVGILGTLAGLVALGFSLGRTLREISASLREVSADARQIAGILERIDARLHRQYADIDRDLQEIRDLLQGEA